MAFVRPDLTDNFGLEARTYCPVGKIFPQVHVFIMDENFNTKSIGEAGEVSAISSFIYCRIRELDATLITVQFFQIYIGGPALAIGYLNQPDLNEQRFIGIPAHLAQTNGKRLYRTGDWGYLLSDGSLEVIGRCDSMVKIRGYTIELKVITETFQDVLIINNFHRLNMKFQK